jgi:integrase
MAGRKSKPNWTPSRDQYTTTIDGEFHLLGRDKAKAEAQFRFLLNKADLGEIVDKNPFFAHIADQWLDFVKKNHAPERYRLCKGRLEEFVEFVGPGLKVRDLRASHVERWITAKKVMSKMEKVKGQREMCVAKPGTERGYKAIILAALNWAAKPKVRLISANPIKGLLDLPEGEARAGDVVWPAAIYERVLKMANPAFADVVRILALTGARPSTVCMVEARHFRPDLKLWDVEDLYKRRLHKKKYVKRIWLLPEALELVKRKNAENPTGPIFRNAHGQPWNPAALGVYLFQMQDKFKATKGLEWPDKLCMYGLRHSFATKFIVANPDKLEYLRELLGHKDMKMIRKHYGHLFDEHSAIHDVLKDFKVF